MPKMVSKTVLKCPKKAPRRSREAPKTASNGVRRLGNALRRPKRPPRSPQRPPRGSRRLPRGLQEALRKAPAGPKSAPRGSQEASPSSSSCSSSSFFLDIPPFLLLPLCVPRRQLPTASFLPHLFPEVFPQRLGEHSLIVCESSGPTFGHIVLAT